MKVQFTKEHGCNPFKSAIVAAAIDVHVLVRMNECFVSFEVSDWSEFLHLVWLAAAECSRDHRGQWMVERTPLSVLLEDGRKFSTFIWYDEETKGLRYVSLY